MKEYVGLSNEEVIKNRKLYGKNEIEKGKGNNLLSIIISSLGDPIIRILLIALAVKTFFFLQSFDWFETIGILITIIMASFISSISEYGSEKAFNMLLEESSRLKCICIRNNVKQEIFINELVKDDIVCIESGNKVPADGVLIDGLIGVDESSLNGETKEKKIGYNDQVLKGSIVLSGKGIMKVNAVGNNTFYGKLAEELKETSPSSPLKKRLVELAKIISVIGYIGSFIIFISYLLLNGFTLENIIYALTLSVTIIIVCVPEGLPMMVALVLSSNMKKMLKDNVLVRKLMGIETAGSINILFTDKTGTLTNGRLEVNSFISGGLKKYDYSQLIKSPLSKIVKISCTMNNASSFVKDKVVGGNITDQAILSFIKKNNINYPVINEIPFDSKNKYSIVQIDNGKRINLVKGAPEILLNYCRSYYNDMAIKEKLNINDIINIKKYIKGECEKGSRVIALVTNTNLEINNLINSCLVGFLIISDEIRNNVKESLKMADEAGIDVVMLTGDNIDTACSVAKELNMLNNDSIVLTSEELNNMSDEEIKKDIGKIKVIARMLPNDKSRLVRICQEMD